MEPLAELLSWLPDIPRWVELRAELLEQSAVLHGSLERGVVRGGGGPNQCLYALGAPPRELLIEALREAPGAELLATPESQPHLAALLGAAGTKASLSLLARPELLPTGDDTLLLGPEDAAHLVELPEALRGELLPVLGDEVPFAVALCEGRPVSFCYAGAVTETLWDISIDTLEPYRRRGFAAQAVGALVRHMKARGKEPVWGAAEDNPASYFLARKLGFEVVDYLYVFSEDSLASLLP